MKWRGLCAPWSTRLLQQIIIKNLPWRKMCSICADWPLQCNNPAWHGWEPGRHYLRVYLAQYHGPHDASTLGLAQKVDQCHYPLATVCARRWWKQNVRIDMTITRDQTVPHKPPDIMVENKAKAAWSWFCHATTWQYMVNHWGKVKLKVP